MRFPSDIRVVEAIPWFRRLKARTPLKFGGVVMNSVIFFSCQVIVETRSGKRGDGWGAIPLANLWGWPSQKVPPEKAESLMCRICKKICDLTKGSGAYAHPIDIFLQLEPEALKFAEELCRKECTQELMPKLNTLICLSGVDAAIQDAFGLANGIDTYRGYSREYMQDLSAYLGPKYKGRYVSEFIREKPVDPISIFHLVGGLAPLVQPEVKEAVADGLPQSLEEWVRCDGLNCLKVKWRGNDLDWDLKRIQDIFRITRAARGDRERLFFTGDTNEQCDSPEYMVELLSKIKEASPEIFDSLLYVEQPTNRDIFAHPHDFSRLAKLKPVIVDESLTGFDAMEKALELGATGIALKTCKGHSLDMLMVARASVEHIPYSVQDLSVSGLALLHSVGLASRINTIKGVEYNGRQYFPSGSEAESVIHEPLLKVVNGMVRTHTLKGPGLGFQIEKYRKPSEMIGVCHDYAELK